MRVSPKTTDQSDARLLVLQSDDLVKGAVVAGNLMNIQCNLSPAGRRWQQSKGSHQRWPQGAAAALQGF